MNKKEFLESLREYLSYELPERLVTKHIGKYSEYFDEQAASGKSDREIAEELGDPKLIAKSCISAERSGKDGIPGSDDDPDFSKEFKNDNGGGTVESGTSTRGNDQTGGNTKVFTTNGCLLPLTVLIIFFVLILGGIVFLFISGYWIWALLIILLVSGIGSLIRMFKRN